MKRNRLRARDLARIIVLPWAAWWTYFFVASTWLVPHATVQDFEMTAAFAVIAAASAALVWWYEFAGAIMLTMEGLIVAVGLPLVAGPEMQVGAKLLLIVTLAAPPLMAGTLLLFQRLFRHKRRAI